MASLLLQANVSACRALSLPMANRRRRTKSPAQCAPGARRADEGYPGARFGQSLLVAPRTLLENDHSHFGIRLRLARLWRRFGERYGPTSLRSRISFPR